MIPAGRPIRFTDHLKSRLALRDIPPNLPIEIIRYPMWTFHNTGTGYEIAVAEGVLGRKRKILMVAYEETAAEIVAITVHLLDEEDIRRRIQSGRWLE
ncbi:MAG: hypothetical protein GHCLOJNM_00537 [bacterium]|nr:hypothetical protein [bacterium]